MITNMEMKHGSCTTLQITVTAELEAIPVNALKATLGRCLDIQTLFQPHTECETNLLSYLIEITPSLKALLSCKKHLTLKPTDQVDHATSHIKPGAEFPGHAIQEERVPETTSCGLGGVRPPKAHIVTGTHAGEAKSSAAPSDAQRLKRLSLPIRPQAEEFRPSIRGGSGPFRQQGFEIEHSLPVAPRNNTLAMTMPLQVSQPRRLEQYRNRPGLQTNRAIEQVIRQNISPSRRSSEGWLYAFRGQNWSIPGDLQPLKIGYTTQARPKDRFKEIARSCKYQPEHFVAYAVPNPAKYEALVHATFWNDQWHEMDGCFGCDKVHR